jgi:hypothetical protein
MKRVSPRRVAAAASWMFVIMLALVSCQTTGPTGGAARQQYLFTGSITSVDPSLADTFSADMTLSGTFTFEARGEGTLNGTDAHGFRDYPDVLTDFAMVVGSYKAALAPGPLGGMEVVNDFPDNENGRDRLVVSSRLSGKNLKGFAPLCFLSLDDTGRQMLAGTRLDAVGDLSRWAALAGHTSMWYITFSDFGETASVTGVITSVTRAK